MTGFSASRLRCFAFLILTLAAIIGKTTPARSGTPISFNDLLNRERPAATRRLAYGPAPDQFGELWEPKGPGPYPVVALIHGGCWLSSLPGVELMAYIAEDLRRHGIAVWNIEYRRLGTEGAGYPGTFLDVADGMDYLRQIAGAYNLDLSHIVVVGHSAGGQLALWDASRSRLPPSSPLYRRNPIPVRAVVTLAGINDLAAYRQSGPDACGGAQTIDRLTGAIAGGRAGQDVYADTSPAALLPLGVPQVIVSGALDPIVPSAFGENYGSAAKALGDPVEIMSVSGAGHFDLIDPASAGWSHIRALLMAKLF